MKLYYEILKLLFNKYVRRMETGKAVRYFCEHMGITYIKFAQILATQNFGNLFTEKDRQLLSSICDNCNPIPFVEIKKTIEKEYYHYFEFPFLYIDPKPIGSASISQVHKAVLKNGEVVAIKVKRKDITNTIEKDIKRIKKLMYKFGKLIRFKNFIGGDVALDLYLKWILEETDFIHETENIKTYQEFANTVNGKVEGTKEIEIPKLYEELCTPNIIVMEYIEHKTINKMELNEENKNKIVIALNSYIKSSFYALFHGKQVVFHGDPHSGNIYIDKDGNVGFLDMGLLFVLTKEEALLTKQFFINAYTGNYEKLYELLVPYGKMNEYEKKRFKEDIKHYSTAVKKKDITCYFTDLIIICLNYQILPPNFLFSMAKAFVCLNGISVFSNNLTTAKELLQEQTIEFYVNRSLSNCKEIFLDSMKTIPKLINGILEYGVTKGVVKTVSHVEVIHKDLKSAFTDFEEMLDIMKST